MLVTWTRFCELDCNCNTFFLSLVPVLATPHRSPSLPSTFYHASYASFFFPALLRFRQSSNQATKARTHTIREFLLFMVAGSLAWAINPRLHIYHIISYYMISKVSSPSPESFGLWSFGLLLRTPPTPYSTISLHMSLTSSSRRSPAQYLGKVGKVGSHGIRRTSAYYLKTPAGGILSLPSLLPAGSFSIELNSLAVWFQSSNGLAGSGGSYPLRCRNPANFFSRRANCILRISIRKPASMDITATGRGKSKRRRERGK